MSGRQVDPYFSYVVVHSRDFFLADLGQKSMRCSIQTAHKQSRKHELRAYWSNIYTGF